jgi:hypothetical protein
MKFLRQTFTLLFLLILFGNKSYSQNTQPFLLDMSTEEKIEKNLPMLLGSSNQGTDFWLTFHPNNTDAGGMSAVKIYIVSDVETKVTLEIPGRELKQTIYTKQDDIVNFELSPSQAQPYIKDSWNDDPLPQQVFEGLGIHIYSEDPIIVYGMSRYSLTTDGFLGIPTEGYGIDYIVPSWPDYTLDNTQYTSYVSIVGVYKDTEVDFTLGGAPDNYTPGHRSLKIGDKTRKTLQPGDVWIIGPKGDFNDVTGSIVTSTKPVSVISGNYRTAINSWISGSRDYLIEHVLPVSTWGKKYHIAPIAEREKGSMIRIFASEPNTKIYRDGKYWETIKHVGGMEGEGWITRRAENEDESDPIAAITLTSDKPFGVYQYNPSQGDDQTGYDPFMMLVAPVEQYSKKVVFCTPGDPKETYWAFDKNYMNLIYKSDENGLMPDHIEFGRPSKGTINWSPFNTYVSDPGEKFKDPEVTDGRYWKAVQFFLPDNSGVYALQSDEPIMAYGYGLESADSYGYPLHVSFKYLEKNDIWAPSVTYTSNCLGKYKGRAKEEPYDIDSLRSNFASFKFVENDSYNFEIEWDEDDFDVGLTKVIAWDLQVIDLEKDARAVLSMNDRSGNDTTVVIEYEAMKMELSPMLSDFGVVKAIDTLSRKKVVFQNTGNDVITLDSILLVSSDLEKNYDYNGYRILDNIYKKNGGSLPGLKLQPDSTFEFEVEFNPESVSDEIENGKVHFIDSLRFKGNYDTWLRLYCFDRVEGVVKANAGTPVINVDRLDFELTTIGTNNPPSKQQVIYNVGDAALTITDVIASSGVEEGIFSYSLNNDLPIVILPAEHEIVEISFNPKAEAEYIEQIEFVSDSQVNINEHDNILELSGLGYEIKSPTLISPQNKAENIPLVPSFKWNKSGDLEYYRIELSINSSFDNPLINKQIKDLKWTIDSELDYGENYYWRVSVKKDGVAKSSEVWRFKTEEDVSVKDELESTLTILPNPANDYISITSEYTIQSIKVFSQTGELMIETLNAKIDISDLTVGVYFILVESENGIEKGEFIKD